MKNNFIEIKNNRLVFNFNNINEKFFIDFHRTLRIPDNNQTYSLPPSLGLFPLQHIEDFQNVPEKWKAHGGAFLPMYQSEAMWINFDTQNGRPFAIKIASGKINAVSGKPWNQKLNPITSNIRQWKAAEENNDYLVAPKQRWIDGFNVGKGIIRQFVSVPLSSGYTVEEQVSGTAEHGGIQIIVYPMKDSYWNNIKPKYAKNATLRSSNMTLNSLKGNPYNSSFENKIYAAAAQSSEAQLCASAKPAKEVEMGLGAGGFMKQEIYADTYGADAWDENNSLRIFVHLVNSEQYQLITGQHPPTKPISENEYRYHNYPWYEYYAEGPLAKPSEILSQVQSIGTKQILNQETILPDNGCTPQGTPYILGKKVIHDGKW